MDEERADMMDNDSGGMVDRTTGKEVIFGVPTGVEVAVMVMGIDVVATIAELERVEVEMMVSEVGTKVVVFVMIAMMVLLLGRGMVLIRASERVEGTGSVVGEDTVSATVAVVVGFAAAKAVRDAGSLTPAIAQSWVANAYVAAVGMLSDSSTKARLEGNLVAQRGKLTSLLSFVTFLL